MSAGRQPQTALNLQRHLSAPRFLTYRARCSSDAEAMRLYTWNQELSGAVFQMLGTVEIALRNALDRELGAWNLKQARGGTAEWLQHPAAPLYGLIVRKGRDGRTRSVYETAKGRAVQDGDLRHPGHPRHKHPVTHDDALAHVTFGVWPDLLPDPSLRGTSLSTVSPDKRRRENARRTLWAQALRHAFPGQTSEYTVERWVRRVHHLRNRVAHHEPLILADIRSYHLTAARLLRSIDPMMGDWYAGTSPVPAAIARCPIELQP